MPRIVPMTRGDLPPHLKAVVGDMERDHGYVPNSFLTLARLPDLLVANGLLAVALWYTDALPQPLRRLAGFAFSLFSGAMYSAAHLAYGSEELGLSREKLLAVRDWETSPAFTEAERAVLRVCRNAARMPSEVTDRDMSELRRYHDDRTAILLIGLIAWHAFLNRWNDTLATELEEKPRANAEAILRPLGWHGERHT
jgi:alkylhydroperoxidase family enzyme